jgi:hypothetical protein
MRLETVLAELESRGIELRAAGDHLQFRPVEAVPPELVAELRTHKAELLLRLTPAAVVADALGGVSEVHPSLLVAEVCAMRLEDFARAGLVVEVRSEVLGEVVIFASDNARVDPGELRAVYRAHELQVLLALRDAHELRSVHAAKKIFRGVITDSAAALEPQR